MNEHSYIPEFDTPFSFVQRPNALPADLRPIWKVSVILLILLKCCRAGRSTLQRVHVLNWAIRNKESREDFKHVVQGKLEPGDVIVRYEPGLHRAIDFALGQKLLSRIGGDRVQLTATGRSYARKLTANDCLEVEKEFLDVLKMTVTEERIEQIVYMVGA